MTGIPPQAQGFSPGLRRNLSLDKYYRIDYSRNMRIYEYRLRPTRKQEERLLRTLELSRLLYNKGLEELQDYYKETGKHLNRFVHDKKHNKQTDPELLAVVVDTTLARLHKSFANFFRRVKEGQKAGFPRFKSFNRWSSFEFRDKANYLEGKYFKSGKLVAGNIRTIVHREMKGEFRCARIIKKPSGWHLQCVCEERKNLLPKTGNRVGIDVGLKYLIADSNGKIIENDKSLRNKLKKLRRLQRSVARRTKGSCRRRKAVRNLARQHERISNRRKDVLHKVSREYVNSNDVIVMEDLRIQNMVKNHHLALSIQDASWGILKNMLSYKAEDAGREFVLVNPRFTTQTCYKCGELVEKSLSVRTHLCPSCGYMEDRDKMAAKNILRLGLSLQEVTYGNTQSVS